MVSCLATSALASSGTFDFIQRGITSAKGQIKEFSKSGGGGGGGGGERNLTAHFFSGAIKKDSGAIAPFPCLGY